MSALTPEQVAERLFAWWLDYDDGEADFQDLPPLVAALIAEAVDQARAEERERIADRLFAEARLHDEASTGFSGKGDIYATAARIARSQP